MAVAHATSPFITIYKRSGDTFTKLSNPSDLPAGTGRGVAFSSDDTYMAVAHGTSPFITIYKRLGDTFTKLADPADLPAGTGYGVAFSSVGINYLSVACNESPFITIYPRIDSAPLMIKIPDLAATVASMEDTYPPTTFRTAYMRVKP
jgi:galactokinase/mevalonate kinase-like predicted kinase